MAEQSTPQTELAQAITATAQRIGINPIDLATAISYETAGTFDPQKAGPTTQWGQHRGLIQWGEPQARQYGITPETTVPQQMEAVGRYLVDRGVQPGMGLMDVYSAINAGRVGLYNRSDANNGGAPGTVADKVNFQMAGHRTKAERLLAGQFAPMAGVPPLAGAPAPQAPIDLAQYRAPPSGMPAFSGAPQPTQQQAAPQQQAQAPAFEQQAMAPMAMPPMMGLPQKPPDFRRLKAMLQQARPTSRA